MKALKRVVAVCLVFMIMVSVLPRGVDAAQKPALNKTEATMLKGESYTLKLIGSSQKIKWSSSKNDIISISNKGKISAKECGKVIVTAKTGKKTYKCKVTVTTKDKVKSKLLECYNWACTDIWNNGYCNISHFIISGTDAYGDKMDIKKTVKNLNKKLKKNEFL